MSPPVTPQRGSKRRAESGDKEQKRRRAVKTEVTLPPPDVSDPPDPAGSSNSVVSKPKPKCIRHLKRGSRVKFSTNVKVQEMPVRRVLESRFRIPDESIYVRYDSDLNGIADVTQNSSWTGCDMEETNNFIPMKSILKPPEEPVLPDIDTAHAEACEDVLEIFREPEGYEEVGGVSPDEVMEREVADSAVVESRLPGRNEAHAELSVGDESNGKEEVILGSESIVSMLSVEEVGFPGSGLVSDFSVEFNEEGEQPISPSPLSSIIVSPSELLKVNVTPEMESYGGEEQEGTPGQSPPIVLHYLDISEGQVVVWNRDVDLDVIEVGNPPEESLEPNLVELQPPTPETTEMSEDEIGDPSGSGHLEEGVMREDPSPFVVTNQHGSSFIVRYVRNLWTFAKRRFSI